MLKAEHLVVRYGGPGLGNSLDNISLLLNSEKVVIVGPNGSGKTSLIKAFLGLVPAVSGTIEAFGKPVQKISNLLSLSTNLPEVYRLLNLKLKNLLELYADIKGADPAKALNLIMEFQLDHLLEKNMYHLSSGEQKMVCNILSLSFSPETILLDEPFDNVDQGRRMKLAKILNALDCEILLNTHEFEVIKRLEGWSMYFLIEGKLFGKFTASQLPNLYINKGISEGSISTIETSFGNYSISENKGEIPISKARNLSALLEEVA